MTRHASVPAARIACSHSTPYRVFPTPIFTQSLPNPRFQSIDVYGRTVSPRRCRCLVGGSLTPE